MEILRFSTPDNINIASFDLNDLKHDSKDVLLSCSIEEAKMLKILRSRILLQKNFNITFV